MRRKRFKHHVYIFCHMFCGWQLINDLDELARLKNGNLNIDVKSGRCLFNGTEIETLTMPLVLNDWFLNDLHTHSLELGDIDSATLLVEFNMNEFGKKKGKRPEFHCSSRLVSKGSEYTLSYKGETEDNKVKIA